MLNYSTALLNTTEECDRVEEVLLKSKQTAQSKLGLSRDGIDRHEELAGSTPGALDATKLIRDSIEVALANMPQGQERQKYEKDKEDLDVRVKVLERRNNQYGVEDLILKQVDYNREENDGAVFDAAIAAVQARKAELLGTNDE